MTLVLGHKLPKHLIRDIAHRQGLRHTDACRDANRSGGFTCRCDFFARVEEGIRAEFGGNAPKGEVLAAQHKENEEQLVRLEARQQEQQAAMRKVSENLQTLDKAIRELRTELAIGQVLLKDVTS